VFNTRLKFCAKLRLIKAGLHWGQARLSQAKLSVGKCLHLQ